MSANKYFSMDVFFYSWFYSWKIWDGMEWNWGENVACCSSDSVSVLALPAETAEHIALAHHRHHNRLAYQSTRCWFVYLVSIENVNSNIIEHRWAHVYASLMRVIIKTHYEFQIYAEHRHTISLPYWIYSRALHSLMCHPFCGPRSFCFLAQFLLHDNIIASEPHSL